MSKRMCSIINWNHVGKFALFLLGTILFCEFLIYYIVLLGCSWPQLDDSIPDNTVHVGDQYKPLKAMVLADIHLLGPKTGHWFDKLRREWQMHRSFQAVMTIHNPEVVFFLGDVFDEGYWTNSEEFRAYVARFYRLFEVPEKTKIYVAAGNHDVGFHYAMRSNLLDRFVVDLKAPSVDLVTLEGNVFVLINSMAMEGDGCDICAPAEQKLKEISQRLHCESNSKTNNSTNCNPIQDVPENVRPILLQHFPLYRSSDSMCTEPDSAPLLEKNIPFREKWECLSKDASEKLFKWLRPRLVIDGHTHHGCHLLHKGNVPEWTVASFSWRNKNNPSFLLVTITPNNHAVSKCYLPQESTVIGLYVTSGILLLLWIIFTRRKIIKGSHYSKIS